MAEKTLGGNRGGDGPPDIDEIVKKLKENLAFLAAAKMKRRCSSNKAC